MPGDSGNQRRSTQPDQGNDGTGSVWTTKITKRREKIAKRARTSRGAVRAFSRSAAGILTEIRRQRPPKIFVGFDDGLQRVRDVCDCLVWGASFRYQFGKNRTGDGVAPLGLGREYQGIV